MQINSNWYDPAFTEILKRSRHQAIPFVVPSMPMTQYLRESILRSKRAIADIAYTAGMSPDGLRNVLYGKRALKEAECQGLGESLKVNADMLRAMIERETM